MRVCGNITVGEMETLYVILETNGIEIENFGVDIEKGVINIETNVNITSDDVRDALENDSDWAELRDYISEVSSGGI